MTGPRYKWVLVAVCFCVGALNYADRAAISSVFPLIRADLHLSNVEMAAVGSLFLWAYALASPFAGMLADRASRSRVIVGSLVAWSLITFASGFVTSTQQLLSTRVLLGFFEAAYLPAAMALIADHHAAATRATAFGLHSAGLTFGLVAGGAGAGYIGQYLGWHAQFFFFGFLGLLLGVIAYFLLHDAAPVPDVRRERTPVPPLLAGTLTLLRIPSVIVINLASMFVSAGNNIFIIWLPLYFSETYQMGLGRAGFAGTFTLQIASVIALVGGGLFSDRFAGKKTSRRMVIHIVCSFLAAPFLLVFLAPRPDLIAVSLCIFLFAFVHRFGDCNFAPLLCEVLPPRLRSSALGLHNAANCLAGGIGVMLAGVFKADIGLDGVFIGIAGFTVISGAIMLIGRIFFLQRDLARQAELNDQDALELAASASR